MKVGEVIIEDGNAFVIKSLVNGAILDVVKLEDYIMNVVTIKDNDGRMVTVNHFVKERCTDYINGVNVYEL